MKPVTSRTGGVDLAAASERTAIAIVDWSTGAAALSRLVVGASDEDISDTAAEVDKLGIDCAFGWPDEFVTFVSQHAVLQSPPVPDSGIAWRRTLAYRATDRAVREAIGRWPLSVSTDRLGLTAMRCAALLGRLEAAGHPIDRAGRDGLVAEVYPGGTLRAWHWHVAGYRTDPAVRRELIGRMRRELPQLHLGGHEELMERSADALDAVIAALTARAAMLGQYTAPADADRDRARREGWIVLPVLPPGDLLGAM